MRGARCRSTARRALPADDDRRGSSRSWSSEIPDRRRRPGRRHDRRECGLPVEGPNPRLFPRVQVHSGHRASTYGANRVNPMFCSWVTRPRCSPAAGRARSCCGMSRRRCERCVDEALLTCNLRTQSLGLHQDKLGCLFSLIGRIPILVQNSLYSDPHLCPDTLLKCPVNGYVLLDGFN